MTVAAEAAILRIVAPVAIARGDQLYRIAPTLLVTPAPGSGLWPARGPAPAGAHFQTWVPACEGVIRLRYLAFSFSYPSFPRKREPRTFSHLLLGPRSRGDDGLSYLQDLLTASCAGKTWMMAACFPNVFG